MYQQDAFKLTFQVNILCLIFKIVAVLKSKTLALDSPQLCESCARGENSVLFSLFVFLGDDLNRC